MEINFWCYFIKSSPFRLRKANQPSSPEEAKNTQTVTIGYTQFPINIDPADIIMVGSPFVMGWEKLYSK